VAEGYAEPMEQFRRGELVFDVIDAGPADGPVVVLLHGFPEQHTMWQPIIPQLTAQGYRCLAPRQRGYSPGARPRRRQMTVPVSAGLLTDTDAYFDALGAYRRGDPAPIVEKLSTASVLAVVNGRRLVSDLRAIRAEWASTISARRDSAIHRVADLLLKRPVFNAQLLQRELDISTGNARRYVDPLTDAGIIVEFTDRSRNRAWRAPQVLHALDAFALRAGRRGLPG
jgi:pimeloyl-ACP methyl ester carboxylesterase